MSENVRYDFKIVLIGESGVGKSCLSRRYVDDLFTDQCPATIGIGYKMCVEEVSGHLVRLELWDTAGEERYRSVMPFYYRGAHGAIVVYDCTSVSSFRHVPYWMDQIAEYLSRGISISLVGNKCDEVEGRVVTKELAARYAERFGIPFCEASAKSGQNVRDIFSSLATNIYNRVVPTPSMIRGSLGMEYAGQSQDEQDMGVSDESISLVEEKASKARSQRRRRSSECC